MREVSSTAPHVLIFPFMSKGHTIPLLDLVKLIHVQRPRATFNIFTTPANEPFISLSVSSLPKELIRITSLPFPATTDLPPGVESTDKLPSMSLFHDFTDAVEQLQPHFETALENDLKMHQNGTSTTFLISDGFLHWTQESASKFNIPRLYFYGMNCYAVTICRVVLGEYKVFTGNELDGESVQVPHFPWISVTKNDVFNTFNAEGRPLEFVMKCAISTSKSYGCLVNTFDDIELKFLDYCNSKYEPKNWSVGPLCLAEKPKMERLESDNPIWMKWLDQKLKENERVLYVAFGTQAEISDEQLKEIIVGLEKSGVNFLWALKIKPKQEEIMEGFEERIKNRGLVVREWIAQREVLEHETVQGFLSHCGWNSVLESICASVPILAWPMTAEQPLNAKMVVEEIKVGVRLDTIDMSIDRFVSSEELSKKAKELMDGEIGKEIRDRVKPLSKAAQKATEEHGASWKNLATLLDELEAL